MAHPRRPDSRPELLKKVRELCLSFPETREKEAWGGPTFRVKDKMFVMYMNDHHADGRLALWCKADADDRDALVAGDAQRFFAPPYVGHKGWLGVRIDRRIAWKRVSALVEQSYRLAAPKRVLAAFDAE
jgi:predicted DNA-binding protein (MmcQ/YjbR family)